jgi:hypothetical protein
MRTRKNAREERGYARIHAHVSGMHADSRFSRSFALAVARKHKKKASTAACSTLSYQFEKKIAKLFMGALGLPNFSV